MVLYIIIAAILLILIIFAISYNGFEIEKSIRRSVFNHGYLS